VSNPFIDWLPDVVNDEITICVDDIEAEARGNLWTFTVSMDQVAATTVSDVIWFAEQVIEARRASLIARNAGPMVIYWWHDSLAGQLRLSLVSILHDRLPFACATVAAPNLVAVIEDWLGSPYMQGIPWSELSSPVPSDSAPTPKPIRVWTIKVP